MALFKAGGNFILSTGELIFESRVNDNPGYEGQDNHRRTYKKRAQKHLSDAQHREEYKYHPKKPIYYNRRESGFFDFGINFAHGLPPSPGTHPLIEPRERFQRLGAGENSLLFT